MENRLKNLYDSIFESNLPAISAGGTADEYLKNIDDDKRMSITLIFRPDKNICHNISCFCRQLADFPQYYIYPADTLHITVLDIFPSATELEYGDKDIEKYKQAINNVLKDIPPFKLTFQGITASDNAVLIKGFHRGGLEEVRSRIRKKLKENNLEFSERYRTTSCHITAARLTDRLAEPEKLTEFVKQNRDYPFGNMTVYRIELTYHNRYDTRKTNLADICLKGEL